MLEGKWLFIWNISAIEGGNVQTIASKAKAAGYAGLCIKILDGTTPMNQGLLFPLFTACKALGIKLATWGYYYGMSVNNATSEANAAATQINDQYASFQVIAHLIDVEAEYKAPGSGFWAEAFMDTLTAKIPGAVKLGLCSYRYPNSHLEMPWSTFLAKCHFHAPQVYWEGSHNPAAQLLVSYEQLTALKPLPFYPVGSAYCNGGWCATPADCVEFAEQAALMGLPGINFWAWHSAVGIAGMWETLAALEYTPITPPPPPVDPESPVLVPAHTKADALPYVNVRKNPLQSATKSGDVKPLKNVWVTKIYPLANGTRWVGVIVPGGAPDADDLAGFMAFTWQGKDLLAWGHV